MQGNSVIRLWYERAFSKKTTFIVETHPAHCLLKAYFGEYFQADDKKMN